MTASVQPRMSREEKENWYKKYLSGIDSLPMLRAFGEGLRINESLKESPGELREYRGFVARRIRQLRRRMRDYR